MSDKPKSARQELRDFAGSGRLRRTLEGEFLSREAVQLAVDVVLRYCEPRSSRKRQKQ